MKLTKLIAIALLITSFSATAQTVTATDMLEGAKCADKACFEKLITAKGFVYNNIAKTDTSFKYYYDAVKEKAKPENADNYIVFRTGPTQNAFAFITGNENAFKELIKLFREIGFNLDSNESIEGGMIFIYKSTKHAGYELIYNVTFGKTTSHTFLLEYFK